MQRCKARCTRLESDLEEARRHTRSVLLGANEATITRHGRTVPVLTKSALARLWGTGATRMGEWIERARFERDGD